jgi:hypothetical protein
MDIAKDRPWRVIAGSLVFAGMMLLGLRVGLAQGIPHASLPECQQDDPDLLLPDLIAEPPTSIRELYVGSRRYLQFTTAIGNIGDGPLLLEGRTISTSAGVVTQAYQLILRRDGSRCARPAGQFEFHDRHRHWHFERFAGYELRRGDPLSGELLGGGTKTSFCLLDIANIRGYHPQRFPRQLSILTCKSAQDLQGISVGWKDVYDRILPGQSINLDPDPDHRVPQGSYYLVNVADPDHQIWELDTANNAGSTVVGLSLSPLPLSGPVIEPPTERPRQPRLRQPRVRPTRPPRVPIVQVPAATPTPRPTATQAPVVEQPANGASCENACPYAVSQLRLTWYDQLGLQVSAVVNPGGCPALNAAAGTSGTVQMLNWFTESRRNTGLAHQASFTLSNATSGRTDTRGTVAFTRSGSGMNVTYSAPVRPFARASDGANFPVVFDLCLTLGDQAVKARMVCQPKNTGMLCHK